MIPWAIKLVKAPGGKVSSANELNLAKLSSIKSIGIFDHSKMDWKIGKQDEKENQVTPNLVRQHAIQLAPEILSILSVCRL